MQLIPSRFDTFGNGAPWIDHSIVFMVDAQVSEVLAASGFDQEIPYNAEIINVSIQMERRSKEPHLTRLFFLLNGKEVDEITPEILNDPELKACVVVENQNKFNQVEIQKLTVSVEYSVSDRPALRTLLGVGF